jgi:sugar phosphate isomerase/epimerase
MNSSTLSLSTAFNIKEYNSWTKYLPAVKKLGFDTLELNVEVPESWMPEIERSVCREEIRISSLHNFCPRLENLPDNRTVYTGYILNSDSEEERELALRHTFRTIEWANRMRAKAVVIHAGEVRTDPSGGEFYRYLQQFGRNGKMYPRYLEALMADRKKKSSYCLELLMKSLDRIIEFAREKDVRIGLENRYFLHEIPSFDEIGVLLDHYVGAPFGYWHDTGHAEVFVRQGWVENHAAYLARYAPRAIGCHLHDLKKLSDHYAPGSGDLDFRGIASYLAGIPLKVVEAHAKSRPKEVAASIGFLRQSGVI